MKNTLLAFAILAISIVSAFPTSSDDNYDLSILEKRGIAQVFTSCTKVDSKASLLYVTSTERWTGIQPNVIARKRAYLIAHET
jgi:hypothetical protein